MREPWRQRCPDGHANVHRRRAGYYCGSCDHNYPGDPYDAGQVEFPVADATGTPRLDRYRILYDLVRILDSETRTKAKAKEIPGETRAVAQLLGQLADDGYVEITERSSHNWYEATAAGREVAGGPLTTDADGRVTPREAVADD